MNVTLRVPSRVCFLKIDLDKYTAFSSTSCLIVTIIVNANHACLSRSCKNNIYSGMVIDGKSILLFKLNIAVKFNRDLNINCNSKYLLCIRKNSKTLNVFQITHDV